MAMENICNNNNKISVTIALCLATSCARSLAQRRSSDHLETGINFLQVCAAEGRQAHLQGLQNPHNMTYAISLWKHENSSMLLSCESISLTPGNGG